MSAKPWVSMGVYIKPSHLEISDIETLSGQITGKFLEALKKYKEGGLVESLVFKVVPREDKDRVEVIMEAKVEDKDER